MKKILFLALIAVTAFSCRKEPNLSQLTDDFLVGTLYEPSAQFASYQTYELPSYVAIVGSGTTNDTMLSTNQANQLLNQVRSNMNSRGYREAGANDTADLAMNIFTIKTINQTSIITPGSYWGYPGYYDPGYWGYYDSYYYYPFSYTYTYNTGTIVMEMVDLKNLTLNNNKLEIIWTSISNGILGTTYSNTQNALYAIDQSFTQSPYIQR